jgi:hypothetical protein
MGSTDDHYPPPLNCGGQVATWGKWSPDVWVGVVADSGAGGPTSEQREGRDRPVSVTEIRRMDDRVTPTFGHSRWLSENCRRQSWRKLRRNDFEDDHGRLLSARSEISATAGSDDAPPKWSHEPKRHQIPPQFRHTSASDPLLDRSSVQPPRRPQSQSPTDSRLYASQHCQPPNVIIAYSVLMMRVRHSRS